MFNRRNKLILAFLILCLYVTNFRFEHMQTMQGWINRNMKPRWPSFWNSTTDHYGAQACLIPKLEMHSEMVREYLGKHSKKFYNCDKKNYALLFNSTLEGEIVPAKQIGEFRRKRIKKCCYQVIERKYMRDGGYRISESCHPLFLHNATKIPAGHEFIVIKCLKGNRKGSVLKNGQIMDMHSFVHVKPEVERRLKKANKTMKIDRKKVNVVILGLDAVSRMNFLRTMPKSYDFLVKKLKGVDMEGYNKVADNTFPNLMPMLTSLNVKEVNAGCGKKKKPYDDCPFMWKRYSEQGYVTSFAEDSPGIAIFNFLRNGFRNQPTDYYMRPFALAANKLVGHQPQVSQNLCYGPRLSFQVLLENMKKFVFQMSRKNRPFFQFTWATSLSHDHLHAPAMGDRHLLSSLEWLEEKGYLNDTVFILMSDHGLRVGTFRNTLQGQLEDRLPIMIIVVPEWMRRGQFSMAYQNLVGNNRRLVTTYDIHETLLDILNVTQIENNVTRSREITLSREGYYGLPRGISLFLPIPKERTCDDADIEPNFCSCTYFKKIEMGWQAKKAASIAITEINSIVKPYEQCISLQLKKVTMAQHAIISKKEGVFYMINFETEPGDGMFEALVSRQKKKWKVSGTISRTSLYRNQSHCVHDSVIKLYCFCTPSELELEKGLTTERDTDIV